MPRKYQLIIIALFIMFLLTGCAQKNTGREAAPSGTPLRIMVATDLHYLSPKLHDDGTMFERLVESGDGKLVEYSEEILDFLIDAAKTEWPDALLLLGDLTFNGEKQSLLELVELLSELQNEGIPVLVIPGNHDIDDPYACRYVGERAEAVECISQGSFRSLCGGFGYDDALVRDKSSFSYLYPLSEDVSLLFLDANTSVAPGEVPDTTLRWAETQLKKAKKEGVTVLTVTHQNLLPQNRLLSYGYIIENQKELVSMLERYEVTANFSGHSHIQHSASETSLIDYCTGALCVYPLRYAMVTIDEERAVTYEVRSFDELQTEAIERFRLCTEKKLQDELAKLEIPEQDKRDMIDFAVSVSRDYARGQLNSAPYLERKAYQYWREYGNGSFWRSYLNSALKE